MHIHLKTVICTAMLSALASAQSTPPRARSTSNIVIQRPSGSYLGVAVVEIDSDRAKTLKLKEERGVEVKLVDENSPASKAGLKEGDVILEYNGQRIEGTTQFVRKVSETPAGRKASLQISRNGATPTLPVTLEARSGRGGFALSLGDMSLVPPMPPMPPMPPAPAAPAVPEI